MRDPQKLEAAQMKFLIPLLGFTRFDRQRNPYIRNGLKVDKIVEYIQLHQKTCFDRLERMDSSRLPMLAFQYQPRGTAGYGKIKTKMERPRTPGALKKRFLRTKPLLFSW
jgi:hypothetical protein